MCWGHLKALGFSSAPLAWWVWCAGKGSSWGSRAPWQAAPLPHAPEGLARPRLCGGCPPPSVPVPEAAVVPGSHSVTQLLEHLSEAVEQSSLFDPQHPGLEEELESLRRRLEALSSSEPSSMETHFSNSAGRLCPASPHCGLRRQGWRCPHARHPAM